MEVADESAKLTGVGGKAIEFLPISGYEKFINIRRPDALLDWNHETRRPASHPAPQPRHSVAGRKAAIYQQDDDRQLQFTGENEIDHTAKDETIRVYVGNSFDLTGERRRTQYRVNTSNKWMEEGFEITLRNHKEETVEIRVVEHLRACEKSA